jgi:hypothetical protein
MGTVVVQQITESDLAKARESGDVVDPSVIRYAVVDGAHRVHALRELMADPTCGKFGQECEIPAMCYHRDTPADMMLGLSQREFCLLASFALFLFRENRSQTFHMKC